jgi:hypothetical protein
MARKLIDQDEAARILGISADQVAQLRDRKKLFPYRDGDQWKYKQEDIEKYRDEMRAEKGETQAATSDWENPADDLGDIDLQVSDDLDSILLSEVEMGGSSTEGASTIIGKTDEGPADELDLPPALGKPATPPPMPHDSDTISLDDIPDQVGGSVVMKSESNILHSGRSSDDSKVSLGGGGSAKSDSVLASSSSGFSLVGDSNISSFNEVKLVPSESDIGKKGGSSDKLFGSDALQISDDDLKLMEVSPSSPAADKSAEGSKKSSGSSIKLGDEELEVVMGSKTGSDLTQSPSDSGIQLISASDSGLSLDEPLALGSSAKRLLDIPGEGTEATQEIAAEGPVELKGDEDFLLTALDEGSEESSDSGSQVIALDADEEMSSGMFGGGSGAALLEEEPVLGAAGSLASAPSGAFAPTPAMMGATSGAPVEGYSTSNIVVLSVCAVLLMLCGMFTFDLMRNMWSWDGPYTMNSSILDSIGRTVGWFEK